MMSRTESVAIERKTGTRRSITQIQKTMKFEFHRNWIKLLSMIGTSVLIYILNIVVEVIRLNRGGIIADNASDYFISYLGFLNLVIYIIGVTFAGTMIVEDFEKSTGNLLFPKIPKHRLLIGRFIARYVYGVSALLAYYTLVGITTIIRFGELPFETLLSFGWAAYYLLAVFSFVTFFSSFFKRSTGAIVVSLIALLMVFTMIQAILTFTGVEAEVNLFFLTYYGNIISAIFNMPLPTERYQEIPIMGPGGVPSGETFFQWSTPSELGAGIGLLVYSIILLASAYIIYRFKQNKANM